MTVHRIHNGSHDMIAEAVVWPRFVIAMRTNRNLSRLADRKPCCFPCQLHEPASDLTEISQCWMQEERMQIPGP